MLVRWASQVSNWRVALTTFMRATIRAGKWEVNGRGKEFFTTEAQRKSFDKCVGADTLTWNVHPSLLGRTA